MARSLRKTTESFIEEAKKVHKNFYDYSETIYTGCYNLVTIKCPIHGSFEQKASSHLFKQGCYECGRLVTIKSTKGTTESFIRKSKLLHGDTYLYDKVNYISAHDGVIITCKEHGDFKQRANDHLNGNGCTICYSERNGFGRQSFMDSCKKNAILYVIRCYSEKESFIKIGITGKSLKIRFKRFPYNYEVIKTIEGSPEEIFNREKVLHRTFKNYRYIPQIKFRGSSECFTFNNNILNYDL